MKLLKANKGIHVPLHKEATEHLPVETYLKPEYVYIPMAVKSTDFDVYVKEGDQVKLGQKVAKRTKGLPLVQHATVSGEVVKIERKANHMGQSVQSIVIKNDFKDTLTDEFQGLDVDKLDNEAISNYLLEGGIVGLGGAGFPTFMKYKGVQNIDTVILNGAECEPYITADYRTMIENAEEMFDGLSIMMKSVKAEKGMIAIKEHYTEANEVLSAVARKSYPNISVVVLKNTYPAGWEKTIVYQATGRSYERLPLECGVIVNNVQTAISVSRLFRKGIPLVDRVITVTGEGIVNKKNLLVRIGTLVNEIVDFCGGLNPELNEVRLISGGPMMGPTHKDMDYTVTKETNGVLVLPGVKIYEELPKEKKTLGDLWSMMKEQWSIDRGETEARIVDEQPCVRCMACVEACPAKIKPTLLSQAALHKDEKRLEELDVLACINCGACTFVCPSHIPLAANIQRGQTLYKAKQRTKAN